MVHVLEHLPKPELLLGGKMQHILLPAPTKGQQPAELGICIGFSAPSSALWGFGSSFAVGCDPKDKAGGKGWLESSGHGRSQLLCLRCSGGDKKMLVLRKRRVPGQLFTPSPRHPDTETPNAVRWAGRGCATLARVSPETGGLARDSSYQEASCCKQGKHEALGAAGDSLRS